MVVEGTQHHEWLGGPAMSIILAIVLVGCLVTILVMRSKENRPTYLIGGMGFAASVLAVLLVGSGLYAVYGNHDHITATETGKRYYPASLSSQRDALDDYYHVRYKRYYESSLYLSEDGKYYDVCETSISKVDSKHFKVEAKCDGKTLPVPKSKD